MMPRLTTTFLVSLVVFVTILDCQRVEAADVNKMIVEMFKKADKNKDGKWSFAEYLQRDENLIKFEKQRFRKHDANGDNFITLKERQQFFAKQAAEEEKGNRATNRPKPKRKSG